MNKSLTFHASLILRTPAYPFESQFDESFIRRCLSEPGFREALYLASPGLHDECIKWCDGTLTDPKRTARLLKTVVKYYLRASSRCTPFGLFAGCSVIRWGDKSTVPVSREQYYRHTRLDTQYLSALVGRLAENPVVREKLRYFPNSSIYQVGDEVRYVEYQYVDDSRLYQISSVLASEYLLCLLAACREGLLIGEIVQRFTRLEPSITPEEGRDFVLQLIGSQLLVSELEPSMTGEELMYQVLDVLESVAAQAPDDEVTGIIQALKSIDAHLKTLDADIGNGAEPYQDLVKALHSLEVPVGGDNLFQVDLSMAHTGASLDKALQDDLIEALEVLHQFTPAYVSSELEHFKTRFASRYGDKEMPLLEVLDDENGIGYSSRHGGISSLLTDDLVLTGREPREQTIETDETQRFIHNKLIEAQKNGSYTVEIRPGEIKPTALPPEQLPPSMAVLFRLVDHGTILLEGGMGSSAVNLLGRFAHTNPQIAEIIHQITAFEQQTNPEVALAEVNHLPQSRTGNILSRPVFRDFEIPYLARSPLPLASQIPLSDLLVSLKNNQVTLRSRQLNKVIIPRLSTAHNCTSESLPVYNFLCDMQTQALQPGLTFHWESLFSDIKFLPRVTFKKTILYPATWYLSAGDLAGLVGSDAGELAERFAAFQRTWRLPRYFTLNDGDTELLVDAGNPLTVQTWLETIKNRDSIKLREFLFDPSRSVVTDNLNRPYVNQFIALLMRENPAYRPQAGSAHHLYAGEQHKFWLGSEWLYYKLYCGQKSSDRILTEAIGPLTKELTAGKLVDKWFFVRYADPDSHLRVRFHLHDHRRIGEVVLLVNQYLEPYLVKEYIWKSQTDTYVRELERYGYQSTELSETLFCHDSVAAVAILEQTAGDAHEAMRWLWGIRSVDELLNAFSLALPDKQRLIGQVKEAFGREFGMNKSLKLQLDAKYRSNKKRIWEFLDPVNDLALAYPDVFVHIGRRNEHVRRMAERVRQLAQQEQLGVSLTSLVSDHVHMLLNRLIPVNQRLHEMIIYDFLFRQYQAMAATRKG